MKAYFSLKKLIRKMMNLKMLGVAKPHEFLEDLLKTKLSGKKIINCVKWKPFNMDQLRFDLEVMKWLARENMPFIAATSDVFKDLWHTVC